MYTQEYSLKRNGPSKDPEWYPVVDWWWKSHSSHTWLDLSAAFDTIDHSILLSRLEDQFGVTTKPFDWLKFYSQTIKLVVCPSSKLDLPVGVPRGSVLCPPHFTLYTCLLIRAIPGDSVASLSHADNSQLYVSFASGDSAAALCSSQKYAHLLPSHGCQWIK